MKTSTRIASRQKIIYLSMIGTITVVVGSIVFFTNSDEAQESIPQKSEPTFQLPSENVDPEKIRLAQLETVNDLIQERLQSVEQSLVTLKEENTLLEREKDQLLAESTSLKDRLQFIENSRFPSSEIVYKEDGLIDPNTNVIKKEPLKVWEQTDPKNDRHVLYEIPAGTVVKAVLVSGADCSVAISKPTGPNMILLRPLDNGKLPRNVRVALKGSVIVGNAVGDIASERVYVRAERMTLVERSGSFIETELSAYVSGEDGREGLRGVVVDRSGQIITRAAFASFLQGIGQTVEGVLNNQAIEKLAKTSSNATILNLDMFRTSAIQGGVTAVGKMADYYIRRAEQLQPTIQIAAGRVVDVVFTKAVKLGEKDLRKKFEKEREARLQEAQHG